MLTTDVGLTTSVENTGLGISAVTTTLRRMTMRPAESASENIPACVPRTPVSVYLPAIVGGTHVTVMLPLPSTCTESGTTPTGTSNRTYLPAAGFPSESSTCVETLIGVAPATTVSIGINDKIDELKMIGSCGASGLFSGNYRPITVGVIEPAVAAVTFDGPAQMPLSGMPAGVAITVASAIAAPRASRATGLIGMESGPVSTARSGSTFARRAT